MNELETSVLGGTGLTVTKLGFGAMELRGGDGQWGRAVDRARAGDLLNRVLDSGINFIDTSPDYGRSEELIGRHLSHRRDEFVLASKCGCVTDAGAGSQPGGAQHVFTRENIRAGVEQSLRRMRTDHLDLVQVHASPTRATLEDNDAVAELELLRQEGKLRFVGMSGTLPNITDHIAMGVFDTFQIPYSAVERDHEQVITEAASAGAGTIIRGGIARGLPAAAPGTSGRAPEEFKSYRRALLERRERFDAVPLDDLLDGMTVLEFVLRFTLSHPDLDTTILGTANPDHLAANVEVAARGPLPADVYEAAKQRLPGH